jgi:hypothetical protein
VSAYRVPIQGYFTIDIDGGATQVFYSLARRKFASPVAVERLDIKSAILRYRLRAGTRYACLDYWEKDTEDPPRHLIVAQFVVDPEEPYHIRWEKSFSLAFYSDSFLASRPPPAPRAVAQRDLEAHERAPLRLRLLELEAEPREAELSLARQPAP